MLNKKILLGLVILFLFFSSNAYCLNLDEVKASFLKGDYKEAILKGEKLVAKAGHSSSAYELYYILGLCYLKDGNYLRASDIFEIVLNEFNNKKFKAEATLGLGDTYLLRGDYKQAIKYYQDILNNDSFSRLRPTVYQRLSYAAYKMGNLKEAKIYRDKLKSEYPLSIEVEFKDYELPDFCPLDGDYYTVQVGSFANRNNAENLIVKLKSEGFPAYMEESVFEGKSTFRVKIGKFSKLSDAKEMEDKLAQKGYPTKVCP